MSQKYAIAKNRAIDAFFTKSSSYDRPQWVNESAASIFLSVEAAEAAARKLYKHGAYEARVVALKEEIQLELPDDQPTDAAPVEDDKPKMVAQVQGDPDEVPAYSDQLDDDGDPVDDPDAIEPAQERPGVPLDDSLTRESLEEDATMPARAPVDSNEDNKNTVVNGGAPKYDKITYKNPAVTSTDDYAAPVAGAADDKIAVPSTVKSDLSKAIADFKKQAEFSNVVDDTRASFCKTVAAAFEQLQELLNDNTVQGLKKAQVFMQSWMNPITTNLPLSVRKFVETGGRKSSLKDLFDAKWDAKRSEL